ncbi:hypothetical protein Tco_0100935 [Tanacetum coccineum]
MAPVCISSGPEPIMMTPGQLNSGLVPSPVPATTYIPPTDKDLEILFQPMFDEYFDQSTDSEPVPTATVVNAPIVSTNTSISTTIAQDAPSTSHSLSTHLTHLSYLRLCLTGKTSGGNKPRHPVLQMLWGIITQTNVDHAELLWEEFTQGIQTFFSHKASHKTSLKDPKKKVTPLLIPQRRK